MKKMETMKNVEKVVVPSFLLPSFLPSFLLLSLLPSLLPSARFQRKREDAPCETCLEFEHAPHDSSILTQNARLRATAGLVLDCRLELEDARRESSISQEVKRMKRIFNKLGKLRARAQFPRFTCLCLFTFIDPAISV